MNPILSLRKAVFSPSDSLEVSTPSIIICPDERRSKLPIMLSRVVFPHPDAPMIAIMSPFLTVRSTPRRAWTSFDLPSLYRLSSLVMLRISFGSYCFIVFHPTYLKGFCRWYSDAVSAGIEPEPMAMNTMIERYTPISCHGITSVTPCMLANPTLISNPLITPMAKPIMPRTTSSKENG